MTFNLSIFNNYVSFTKKKAWEIYVNMPNGSTKWTGWRYPGIPRLYGDRIPFLSDEGGNEGVYNNFSEAFALAEADPSGMCYYWLGEQFVLIVANPELAKTVLSAHFKPNDAPISREKPLNVFKLFWGTNLNTISSENWQSLRKIYNKHLGAASLENYTSTMQKIGTMHISKLQDQQDEQIDIDSFIGRFVLTTALNVYFGFKENISESFVTLCLKYLDDITNKIFTFAQFQTWAGKKEDDPEVHELKMQMKKFIQEEFLDKNKEFYNNKTTLLGEVARFHQKGNEEITIDSIFGDLSLVFLASQDTSSFTLQFALKLLVAHPEVLQKLQDELDNFDWEQSNLIQEIYQLPYLTQVIKEAMRLYPPVAFSPRAANEKFKLNEIPLFPGDLIFVPVINLHHSTKIWGDDAKSFNPERFSEDNLAKIPEGAYLPFNMTTFVCPGQRYAMLQVKFFLALLAKNFNPVIEENDFTVTFNKGVTRPKYPTLASFKPRSSNKLENESINNIGISLRNK